MPVASGADRAARARARRRGSRPRRERPRRPDAAAAERRARLDGRGRTGSPTRSATATPVTLVPTGPLTNVARTSRRTARTGIDRIVLMGGSIAEGNMTPAAEFNIWADPEAAQIVVRRRARRHDDRPRRDAQGRDGARRAEPPAGRRVGRRLRRGARRLLHRLPPPDVRLGRSAHPRRGRNRARPPPGLVETKLRNVEVELGSDLCRGRTVVDLWLRTGRPANAHVGVDLDPTPSSTC